MKITDQELFELIHLTQRPGMYIGNNEIESIEAFLIGYDFGRKSKIRIHRQLIKFIFENHRDIDEIAELEKRNVHFLKLQIGIISKKTDKTELQIFREEAMKFFVEISDNNNLARFKNIIKGKIIEALKIDLLQVNQSTPESIITSQIGNLAKQIKEWKGENFKPYVLDQIDYLNKLQLNKQVSLMQKVNPIDLNKSIISEINKLLKFLQ